jgi:hypothetical protein
MRLRGKYDADDGGAEDGEFAITAEDGEWMKTPTGAAMLVMRELRKAEQHARNCRAISDSVRAEFGEERFRQLLADPDPQYDVYREMERHDAQLKRWLGYGNDSRQNGPFALTSDTA